MKFFFTCLVLLSLVALPLRAEDKPVGPAAPSAPLAVNPADAGKVPDVSNILFIQNLRKIGATIYYLGQDLGLNGWFVVKDGQVQMFYTTPDSKALIVGALLSAEGANISQQQVMLLANNNPAIQDLLKKGTAGVNAAPASDVKKEESKTEAVASPSEQFYAALLKSANLTFGKAQAPQLIMIMDVLCPHCHNTWKKLAPHVEAGAVKIVMVPIAGHGTESAEQGGNLLGAADPYDIWKKTVAGDDKLLKIGKPAPEKQKAVMDNTGLAQNWKVNQTPYLVYRGKNGKIRLIEGAPKDIDVLLNDLGQ